MSTTIFSITLDADDSGGENYSERILIKAVKSSGTSVAITFQASSAAQWDTDNVSIGVQAASGNPFDTKATPVELKFSGASGFSIAAGGSLTSDMASLSYDIGDTLVVTLDNATTNGNPAKHTSNGQRYYKSATNSYADAAPAGSWTTDSVAVGVSQADAPGITVGNEQFFLWLPDNDSGAENYSQRILVGPMANAGTKLFLVLQSGSGVSWLDNVSVGIQDTTYNTLATPVEATFGGASGLQMNAYQTRGSDAVSLSYNAGDYLIVVVDFSSTNGRAAAKNAGGTRWYKSGTNSYNQAAPAGSWSSDTKHIFVALVMDSDGGAVAGSSIAFRQTLSALGTRTGSRQIIGG